MADEDFWFGTLSATVRVENLPGARRIVAVELMDSGVWRVCGSGTSSNDGIIEMAIEGNPTSNIYAMAVDDWGRSWEPGMIVAFGDLVRPSVFKGWMYKCTQPGTLPAEEPDWWDAMAEIPQPVGTAMLQASRHYQPIAHGPVDLAWEEELPTQDLPTIIGEPFGGGYYIGNVTIADGGQDDGQYCIIMAPSGSESTLAWQGSFSSIPETDSLTNGLANSLSAHNRPAASTPAASHCINYRGGDFDDWYLPALEELMLVWTNRSRLTVLGATGAHWSSTQGSSNLAWWVTVHTGASGAGSKGGNYRARPVRRIKIPDL